jgi:hypothetical protein
MLPNSTEELLGLNFCHGGHNLIVAQILLTHHKLLEDGVIPTKVEASTRRNSYFTIHRSDQFVNTAYWSVLATYYHLMSLLVNFDCGKLPVLLADHYRL